MKNWKTTLFGTLLAVTSAITTGVVSFGPQVTKIAAVIQVAATAAFAGSAKDKDVTGIGDNAHRE
jgi:hypothetical protein